MRTVDKVLEAYLESHSSPAPEHLQSIERETHLKTLAPQMLSGHRVGRLLSLISKLHEPRRILEIGTFTGYGSLSLLEGLVDAGELHTFEANEEVARIAKANFEKFDPKGQIHLHVGDALDQVPSLDEVWDLVFIDAAKKQYLLYYQMVIERLSDGGLIIADNVLWDGKVLAESTDEETTTLQEFNRVVQEDERVENLMIGIRDGLMICRKI